MKNTLKRALIASVKRVAYGRTTQRLGHMAQLRVISHPKNRINDGQDGRNKPSLHPQANQDRHKMSNIKDIEIALRDGLIAELLDNVENDIQVMQRAKTSIRLMDQMIDMWRDAAHQYRGIAMELVKAYEEQALELEALKRKNESECRECLIAGHICFMCWSNDDNRDS